MRALVHLSSVFGGPGIGPAINTPDVIISAKNNFAE
jgi:hypothetical protein